MNPEAISQLAQCGRRRQQQKVALPGWGNRKDKERALGLDQLLRD